MNVMEQTKDPSRQQTPEDEVTPAGRAPGIGEIFGHPPPSKA